MSYQNITSKIQNEIINQMYYEDVENLKDRKERSRRCSDMTSMLSYLLHIMSTILAFSSGIFRNFSLEYITGLTNICSLGALGISKYLSQQEHKLTIEMNRILDALHMTEILEIMVDTPTSSENNSKKAKSPSSKNNKNNKSEEIPLIK